jgi:putative DNA primase/helicase
VHAGRSSGFGKISNYHKHSGNSLHRRSLWPVDRTQCEQGNVVILSAEDDPADTIRPRLEAAGADLSKIIILDGVVRHADGSRRAISLTSDLEKLGATLAEIGDVALVVIDPITAYLGDADSHNNANMRALLAPLTDLAEKHRTAMLCVSHLTKGEGTEAMMRVQGSVAFVAAPRAAFLIAKDRENEMRRLFLPIKNNIGDDRTGLAFELQSAQVDSPAGMIDTCRVLWHAEPVTITADELMRPDGDESGQTATEEAVEWLRGLLTDVESLDRREIIEAAEKAGFAERTIYRARKDLGVVFAQSGFGKQKRSIWKLPDSPNVANDPQSCQTNSNGKNGDVGKNEECVSEDDAEVFEGDA